MPVPPRPPESLTEQIIGCAIEVHKGLGPGLFETVYERAFAIELRRAGVAYRNQVALPLYYRGELISEHRADLIVADQVVVEIKSIERLAPVHTAQMLTYLRAANLKLGLILNFNTAALRHGIKRVIL